MKCLLIDFGASRIKTAFFNADQGEISHEQSSPSLKNKRLAFYEYSINELHGRFKRICHTYASQFNLNFEGIILCSEMHGFAVVNLKNEFLTPYISWQDERSLIKTSLNKPSAFSIFLDVFGESFKKITGMPLKPGLPVVNLLHLAINEGLDKNVKVLSLPEILCLADGDSCHFSHNTMAAGLGLFDIRMNEISNSLAQFFKETVGVKVTLNQVAAPNTIGGYWHNSNLKIPIYVGVGDLQCAILGSDNIPDKTISLNLGTGSQVSVIRQNMPINDFELRPFFKNQFLEAITHIPSGRALNNFIGFLEDITKYCHAERPNFWEMLAQVDIDEVINSTITIDLAVFKSAYNYSTGGSLTHIHEGELTLKNYLASLLKCYIQQYTGLIEKIDPANNLGEVVLTGGIAQKIKTIVPLVERYSKRKAYLSTQTEETINGLKKIAQSIANPT